MKLSDFAADTEIEGMGIEEKREEILKDWYSRSGDTFVSIKEREDGYETELAEGEAYSEYLLKGLRLTDKKAWLRTAYDIGKNFIAAYAFPFRVGIRLSKRSDSYTDGKLITASTECFDEKEFSMQERMDVFLGIVVHESCHIKYTDFPFWREKVYEHKKVLIKDIWNILEDEMIENFMGHDYPGHARFLEKVKYYMFDYKFLEALPPYEEMSKFERAYMTFFRLIRFPKYIRTEEIDEFADLLLEIKKVLTPLPHSTKDTYEATVKIYNLFKKFHEDMPDEDFPEEKRTSIEESIKRISEVMESGGFGGMGVLDAGGKSEKKIKSTSEFSGDKEVEMFSDIMEGTIETGESDTVYFIKEEDNQDGYLRIAKKVSPFSSTISKLLRLNHRETKLVHKSMRSGHLDTNKLAEAFQGAPNIYERYGQVTTDKVSVCLLLDESGSMGGGSIEAAKEVAVLFQEALKKVPGVDLYIYGHSGDELMGYSTEIYVYKEPGFNKKYAVASAKARFQNRDGLAIIETAKRVRKFTRNRTLMFVLSDGAPCAGDYGGRKGITDTRDKVKKVESMGFEVIHVAIDSSVPSHEMFTNYIKLLDLNRLAKDLGAVMKKLVAKNAAKHETNF